MNAYPQAAGRLLPRRAAVRIPSMSAWSGGYWAVPGRLARGAAVLGLFGVLAGCVAMPTGPSWSALPGTGRSPEQFRLDDGACRGAASTGGAPPGMPATPGDQYSYDQVYLQCMYMKGHRVPVDASVGRGQPTAGSSVSGSVVTPGADPGRPASPRRAAPAAPPGPPPNPPRSWTGG
jgi:hypothetical protein